MRVALTFRLYMMRYGIGLLAAFHTGRSRFSFTEDIAREVRNFLTQNYEIKKKEIDTFSQYLLNKPSTRRYTPLKNDLRNNKPLKVELQDFLLSNPLLPSSVGALTQDYFDDALSLAHTLKLVNKNQNSLLARGRISLSSGWQSSDPFTINVDDKLFLGLWLLDVDCDWIWAFLRQFTKNANQKITAKNRVHLLMESWKDLLNVREMTTRSADYAAVRARLSELYKITERNIREGLNLGQPWSWFMIPRLELLVDAGILIKLVRHGLSGYELSPVGEKMRSISQSSSDGLELINNYFLCHDQTNRTVDNNIEWKSILSRLENSTNTLVTTVGYLPLYETAASLCVSQMTKYSSKDEPLWEIDGVRSTILRESKSDSSIVRLGLDRQGMLYGFRIKK